MSVLYLEHYNCYDIECRILSIDQARYKFHNKSGEFTDWCMIHVLLLLAGHRLQV